MDTYDDYDVIIIIGIDGLGNFFDKYNMPNLTKFSKNPGEIIRVNAMIPTDSADEFSNLFTTY